MDRYFYVIEQSDNGNKVIHMIGNVYYNDEKSCYEYAEWTFMYLEISEAKQMLDTDVFYDYIDERINYIEEKENYFDGEQGTELHILDITEDTPCGYYWFEREE